MKFIRISTVLLFSFLIAKGQNQSNQWYFGSRAGLDFSSGSPVVLLDGALDILEGCASIADEEGNLLFYTDGISIWNRNHLIMPNGTDLGGHHSSTQSGVIVPHPSNRDLYYVLTVDSEVGPLLYSVVDMAQNGGMGDITTKNVQLLAESSEKITGVAHSNGQDIWVIAHQWNSNAFYAWLITTDGLQTTPVISSVGAVHTGDDDNAIGYMKASPYGDRVAVAIWGDMNLVELLDFDDSSGQLSNPITFNTFNGASPYGLEFSPNGDLLYIAGTEPETIFQIDLTTDEFDMNTFPTGLTTANEVGALQLGSDGKIYLAIGDYPYLGVINAPNEKGTSCDLVIDGVHLGGRLSQFGLPTFIQSFFYDLGFDYADTCFLANTSFELTTNIPTLDSVMWDFGDSDAGSDNISNLTNPTHTFSSAGTYIVQSTGYFGGSSRSYRRSLEILAIPVIELGQDTLLYYGQTLDLPIAASTDIVSYLWQDGDTNSSFQVSQPQTYFVAVSNTNNCTATDTIVVSYDQMIDINWQQDTIVCPFVTSLLDATLDGASYLWSTGETSPTITVSSEGLYSVNITNAYGNRSEEFQTRVSFNTDQCSELPPLLIYNTFTPNGDLVNDYWTIENIESYPQNEIRIYDRLGNHLLTLNNYQNDWDGSFQGSQLAEGTYYYTVRKAYVNQINKGAVTIIR